MLPQERIGTSEAFFLTVAAMIEVGTLIGARDIADQVGVDMWLVSPLETFFSLGAIYILTRLAMKFPRQDFYGFSRQIVGRWLAWPLSSGLLFYWLALTAHVTRVTTDVIKNSLLARTPAEVILLSLLIVAAYLASRGLEPLARASIIIIIVTLPLIMMLFLLVLPHLRFDNFLPILPRGPWPVLRLAFWRISNAEEMSLFLILVPFLQQPWEAWQAASRGYLVVMVVVITVLTTCQGVLGIELLKHSLIPGLSVTQLAEFAGTFIERISLVFISLWIILVFPTVAALLWASAYLAGRLCNLKAYRLLAFYQLPVVYFLARYPGSNLEVKSFFFFLQPLGFAFLLIIPAILYLIAIIRFPPAGSS
ncbi:Spore germination protein YndE [Neomoorella glycerini]|uniref:Spore germination protein YndE n=1 Tax=Neomoorella glycerini TaxID=55779 RepID=A0A6I5ZMC5_9FIRM|nr:GerAB/ArcD/ProY family transporter [Moorella glycerini]QGP90976.1 Spore germination protein YndE [Moorella glycerini]